MTKIIGARSSDGILYQLNDAKTDWEQYPYQPTGGIAQGVWGGPFNTIWAHNGQTGANARYLYFDGIDTWTECDSPETDVLTSPKTIDGSDSGKYVYAAVGGWPDGGGTGHVHRYDGVRWSEVAGLTAGYQIVWCDRSGKHVWVSSGRMTGTELLYSDDYGITWTDMWAGLLSDIHPNYGVAPYVGSVYGTSPTSVYCSMGWQTGGAPLNNGNGGNVCLWDGASWSIVSSKYNVNTSIMQAKGLLWASDSGDTIIAGGGFTRQNILKDSGGELQVVVDGSSNPDKFSTAPGRSCLPLDGSIVAVMDAQSTSTERSLISYDDGATWDEITQPWASSKIGIGSISLAEWDTPDVDFTVPSGEHYNLFLQIDGLEPILWQHSHYGEPDTWGRTIKTSLRASQEASSSIDLATMKAGLSAMTFELDDVKDSDGTSYFAKLFAPARYSTYGRALLREGTEPQQYLLASDTSIPVNGDGENIATGINHIGQETIRVGAVTADELTGVDRGLYPCVGVEFGRTYHRPTEDDGGHLVPISPYPYSWIGRRVALYATQWDKSEEEWVPSYNSELLWTGRISDRIVQSGSDRTWKLSCMSILDDLSQKRIVNNMASTIMRPAINLTTQYHGRAFYLNWREVGGSDGTWIRRIEVDAKYYLSPNHLITEVVNKITAALAVWETDDPDDPPPNDHRALSCYGGFDGENVWLEFRNGLTSIPLSVGITSRDHDGNHPCHALQALGIAKMGGERIRFEVPEGTADGQNGSYELTGKPFVAYQPLHWSYRGDGVRVEDAKKFWETQGDNSSDSASCCIPGAVFDGKTEKKGDFYFAYNVRESRQFNFDNGYRVDYHGRNGVSTDAYAGQLLGDDPAEVRQVYIPRYWDDDGTRRYAFRSLLYPLLSTGSQDGYNDSTYDKLPMSLSVGVQSGLVDIPSFENADLAIKNSSIAKRFPYVIDSPITWLDLVNRECRLFGYAVVWRKGKIALRNILEPANDRSTIEINESTGTVADQYPDVDMSVDTVVNQYSIKTGYDIAHRQYKYEFIISDVESIVGLEVTKAVDIEHPGITVPADADPREILSPFFADRWLAIPNPVVTVSLDHTMVNRVFVGDVVGFVSNRLPDPMGAGDYVTSVYATVLGVQWDLGESMYSGSATLLLHSNMRYKPSGTTFTTQVTDMRRGFPWAPSAMIDRTYTSGLFVNGYDSTNKQLYLSPNEFGLSGDLQDGERFDEAMQIRIIDAAPDDPDSPQEWGPILVDSDYGTDGDQVLTLDPAADLTGFNADREYIVEFADYDDTSDDQKESGTWLANPTTRVLGTATVPNRYA